MKVQVPGLGVPPWLLFCTLATLAGAIDRQRIASPAILVVGDVVSCAKASLLDAIGPGEPALRRAAPG